jgi:hypothetical protein
MRRLERVILASYENIKRLVQVIWGRLGDFVNSLIETVIFSFIVLGPIVFIAATITALQVVQQNSDLGGSALCVIVIFDYGVVILWGLCIKAFRTYRLQDQIDYLNRVPGISELKKKYAEQLYEKVKADWRGFITAVRDTYKSPSMASDLENCIPLRVEDEMLIVGCSSSLIRNRINNINQSGRSSIYYKTTIERYLKKYFDKPDRVWCQEATQDQITNHWAGISNARN